MKQVTLGQYPTPQRGFRRDADPGRRRQLTAREPELDLAGRRLWRIGTVNEVVLSDQGQVTADGAGGGLLHGIGAAGDLTERRNGPRPLHDHGHDGTRGDELE